MSDPFITLWTAQERDARGLSHDELARRSRLLRRRVLRRDLIEYAAGLFVMIMFGWMAVVIPFWPMRVACIVTMLGTARSEEHTSELQSRRNLVCRLLLEKKNKKINW